MSRMLELPDRVYDALIEAAQEAGDTPADWIAARLPGTANGNGKPEPTEAEIAAANARLRACMVDLGRPLGCDNEQIDADLAREYADDHADLYRSAKDGQ